MIFIYIFVAIFLFSLAAVIYPYWPFNKRRYALVSSFVSFVGIGAVAPSNTDSGNVKKDQVVSGETESISEDMLWVVSDRLNRRTCPSSNCGIVGRLYLREGVKPLEYSDGWVRITKYYDAFCVSGQSKYVNAGRKACVSENGIVNGKFAEWISQSYLSKLQPKDPATGAFSNMKIVAQSDDYRKYSKEFAEAARKLIDSGRCSKQQILDHGGFVKSIKHRDRPVYFVYCSNLKEYDKIYFNPNLGKFLS